MRRPFVTAAVAIAMAVSLGCQSGGASPGELSVNRWVVDYKRLKGIQGGVSDSLRVKYGAAGSSDGDCRDRRENEAKRVASLLQAEGVFSWSSTREPEGIADPFEHRLDDRRASIRAYEPLAQGDTAEKVRALVRAIRRIMGPPRGGPPTDGAGSS